MNPTRSKRVDVDTKKTQLKGFKGLFEVTLRNFKTATFLLALLPIYALAVLIMGISLVPGIYLFEWLNSISQAWPGLMQHIMMGVGIVAGYMLYGFTVIFVTPFFNFILPFRLKPFRGPYYSWASVPWYVHNALIYLVRYTFLEFVTPTPINTLFYKMMGMKIGKGVHINTTNISDAALIELEDKVTIGGSAHIICHYAAKGFLVIAPVKIKKGATLGLKCTVMGDVEIGEGAVIGPHEVVLPKSRIPAHYRKKTSVSMNGNHIQ
ncbi:MAG: hypothetical protein D6677_01475 [Calditrichaeota bacterium]|nr:MAG: hypothetical protein D6677_01475 [Calditrichota bacterium]